MLYRNHSVENSKLKTTNDSYFFELRHSTLGLLHGAASLSKEPYSIGNEAVQKRTTVGMKQKNHRENQISKRFPIAQRQHRWNRHVT